MKASVVVFLCLGLVFFVVGSCLASKSPAAASATRGPVANFKMTKLDFTEDNKLQELYKFTSSHNRIMSLLADAPPSIPHDIPAGGSISLLPTGAYFVEVFVGTPPQPVLSLIDSGSNDFLVTTFGCQGCNKPSDTEYDFSNSSSVSKVSCSTLDRCNCEQGLCSFKNVYVTCAPDNPNQICILEGPVLNDVFSIPSAGLSVNVNFGAITFMNITFPGPISAIWGVAANSNYTTFGEVGPLEALAQSGQIADIFAICILQENGTFTLGGADPNLYVGNLSYVPILSESAFLIEMLDLQIDGTSIGLNSSVYNAAPLNASVLDTGTYSLVVPDVVSNAITTSLTNMCDEVPLVGVCNVSSAQNIFNGTCYNMTPQEVDLFPTLTIVLNGTSLTIGGENYLVPNVTSPECMTWGIQNGGPGSITILGDVLMKGFYTVFDKQNMQIGFATANVTACANSPSIPL